MATVTKAMLVKNVCSETGLSPKDAATLVDACFETIKATLEGGEEVKLPGLGVFGLRDKRERPGRNPKTGEDKIIIARRVVTFRSSPALKGRSNSRVTKDHSA